MFCFELAPVSWWKMLARLADMNVRHGCMTCTYDSGVLAQERGVEAGVEDGRCEPSILHVIDLFFGPQEGNMS